MFRKPEIRRIKGSDCKGRRPVSTTNLFMMISLIKNEYFYTLYRNLLSFLTKCSD